MLSVIVPVYNTESYLAKCIDTILSQTYNDFELLLINDGSTDGSKEIIDSYEKKDHRIRVAHTYNKGVSNARNLGIELAKGEWICFIDSDDWIEPNHFTNFFKSNIESSTMVYQGIIFDYEDINIISPFFMYDNSTIPFSDGESITKFRILHNGCPYCKLFNTRIIKDRNIKFNSSLSLHEDHCFVWQYLEYVNTIELRAGSSYHYMKRNNLTLTSKLHSKDEYLIAGNCLLNALSKIRYRVNWKNNGYLNELNDQFGMMQLLEAIVYSNRFELADTTLHVKRIFDKYPDFQFKSIKKKLAFSMMINAPKILQNPIHTLIRKFKK